MMQISVVIPTYNRKEFLEQAIETVRMQTYDAVECIVVDDGSTDGTQEFLESLDYGALRTVYHDKNRGQSVARNAGIDEASGEYIMFLDSDDILYPHAAETVVEAVDQRSEDCVGGFGAKKLVNSRGRIRVKKVPEGLVTEPTLENARTIGGTSCTVFRKDTVNEVDGFDESLERRVDLDLYLKLLKQHSLLGVDEVCCERRIHEGGMSKDTEKVNESYDELVKKHQLSVE